MFYSVLVCVFDRTKTSLGITFVIYSVGCENTTELLPICYFMWKYNIITSYLLLYVIIQQSYFPSDTLYENTTELLPIWYSLWKYNRVTSHLFLNVKIKQSYFHTCYFMWKLWVTSHMLLDFRHYHNLFVRLVSLY